MISVLSAHWFEIVFGALTLVLGAVLGPAIERLVLGGHSARPEIVHDGLTIQQVISVTSVTSFNFNSTVPATPHSPPLTANALSSGEPYERAGILGAYIALAFGAAFVYLKYRTPILVLLIMIMTFGAATSVSALVYLARRGVIIGRSWSLTLLWATFLYATAPLDVYLLQNPVYDTGRYQDLIQAFDNGGMGQLVGDFGLTGVFFVAFQFFGVVTFVLMAYLLLAGLVFLWSSVNIAADARALWFWDLLRRVLRTSPSSTGVVATVMAVLALLLCSGAVGSWTTLD